MRRWILVAAAVAALLLVVFPWTIVLRIDGGKPFRASWRLAEDDPRDPRLVEFKDAQNLNAVVYPGTTTPLEQLSRLRHWVRQQWEPGERFRYPAWDAGEILSLARSRGNRGFCAQYAIVFLQACRAMDWHARYVNLPGHFVVEVWVDELDKWVLEDVLNDIHFSRDGIPLDGRALCQAARRSGSSGIVKIDAEGQASPAQPGDLAVYTGFAILTRANHLEQPAEWIRDGHVQKLTLQSDWTRYPLMGRDSFGLVHELLAWKGAGAPAEANLTGDPDEFNYPFYRIQVKTTRLVMGRRAIRIEMEVQNGADASVVWIFNNDDPGDTSPLGGPDRMKLQAGADVALRRGINRIALNVKHGFQGGPRVSIMALHWPGVGSRRNSGIPR